MTIEAARNNSMEQLVTLADLTRYVNQEVDTITTEEYNNLSGETKHCLSLSDYWLCGADTRRLLQEDRVHLDELGMALLESFLARRRNDLETLAHANFEKLLVSNECNPLDLIDLCAGQDWRGRKNPDGSVEDPWLYLKDPDASHSVYDESFYSKSAAPGVLQASRNVHFDMFKDYFDCFRIQFPSAPQEEEEERTAVSDEFLANLGFAEADCDGLSALLHPHAIRWAKVQVVLFDQIGASKKKNEPLTQRLLEILLMDLLTDLQTHWHYAPLQVFDVTGMEPISVPVTVCANYMTKQAGTPKAAKVCRLIARCDLSVHPENQFQPLDSIFLQALFNIEVKSALTMMRGAGCKEKTQTLAESLARHLKLRTMSANRHLFSILCDVGCLNVLVHDGPGNRSFLSHREISPGRMVAVVAWVLRTARQSILSDGESLNTQLLALVTKDDSGGDSMYKDDSSLPDHDLDAREDDIDEEQNAPNVTTHGAALASDEFCSSESEDEFDAYQREKYAASMAFHKNKLYGGQLPLLKGVLREFEAQTS